MSSTKSTTIDSTSSRLELLNTNLVVLLLIIQIVLTGVLVYRIFRVEKLVSQTGKINEIQSNEIKFVPNIKTEGYPTKGPENAQITIIEFGDYQCVYCKQAEDIINQLFQNHPGQIKLVFRDYPIPSHPYSIDAAEAAACAADQGMFWEMHDALFEQQDQITSTFLPQLASDLGLNMNQWNACMSSHQHKEAIQADAMEGAALGVTGTPNFFVNGYLLPFAGNLMDFENLIAKNTN